MDQIHGLAEFPIGKNEEDEAKRKDLFSVWDVTGNGDLSLAEVIFFLLWKSTDRN